MSRFTEKPEVGFTDAYKKNFKGYPKGTREKRRSIRLKFEEGWERIFGKKK